MDFSEKSISINHVSPKILVTDLEGVKDQAQKVVFNNIKLTYDKKTWYLNSAGILDLLRITKENDKSELGLNKSAFENYVVALSQEINELPRGEVTEYSSDGKVTGFKITENGKELDAKSFSEGLKEAIFSQKTALAIPVKEVKSSDDPRKYGIFTLIGEGKSTYKGSAAGRVHNLSLAAERTSGVLVPPGGIYSLNKSVGEISAATGYNSAYIISNGRTVLGEGGGVCQTSTTLFRAILNAGLPIVMRYPHAYRVSYYEQDMPVGFDASVFQPSLDLQFKNDTPNYVLVQAYPDTANYALTFRIFGTSDGRSVEISKPVISNVSGAPAPLYQDDPTLPKGVVKQVDFAASGATVYFTRKVKNGDEVLFTDTFTSRYQPWKAIFLVGTKE
jgi:vancomycin resistance protein YoaR